MGLENFSSKVNEQPKTTKKEAKPYVPYVPKDKEENETNENYPTNEQATKFVQNLMNNSKRKVEKDQYARCLCYKVSFNGTQKFSVDITMIESKTEQETEFKKAFENNGYSIKNPNAKLEMQSGKLTQRDAEDYLTSAGYKLGDRSDGTYVEHHCFQGGIYQKQGNNLIWKTDVQIEYEDLTKSKIDQILRLSRIRND